MKPNDRPFRSDQPRSTLKSREFGARAHSERDLAPSVIQDAPVTRHAITHLLAPNKVEQGPGFSRGAGGRSGRRVGRDTPVTPANPTVASASPEPFSEPAPSGSTPRDPTLRIASVAEVGEIVRLHRTQLGFSQQRLADLAGIGRRFISELEAGKPSLEFDRVLKCCAALGIDLFARTRL